MTEPRIAIGPSSPEFVEDAVRTGGGVPVKTDEEADGLVWLSYHNNMGGRDGTDDLSEVLSRQRGIRWVQFPFAGVEEVVASGVIDADHIWTCAKGVYAEPVAEHALALALAGLRCMPERVQARSWGAPAGTSLYGERVTILGGGGITEELLRLLAPFGVQATVVRRKQEPLEGAASTVGIDRLDEALGGALVVFLALALTPATTGIIGEKQFAAMDERAWLVNVARGRHVDTDALVAALREGAIAGVATDVTDPEPLPDGHPLWDMSNCIITPHTADTWDMVQPRLSARISENVSRFASGRTLIGLIDTEQGY